MRVLVTGANGFVGKNLIARLNERKDIELVKFTREHNAEQLLAMLAGVDFVFHLAGVNRPQNPEEFTHGNTDLTRLLCEAVVASGKSIPVVYTSSIQAELENPYGVSKRGAEEQLLSLAQSNPVYIFRLPNVFGKWVKPNYNSAVATFCYNIIRGLPIQINDPEARVNLVYIDDVIAHFIALMDFKVPSDVFVNVEPHYTISIGDLVAQLHAFRDSRNNLISERVGVGLTRALYSTYVSYLPPELFSYKVQQHSDPRGTFVEMLKTPDAGQFSFFTAHPGITRGGHYHHSKTEKFLVIKGRACFRFRHIDSGDFHELNTNGEVSEIVETVPGWTHDITNVGEDEMIVMLWANEIFDRERPDTYACLVGTEA
jgi:UDP-2-acetamido-2,6-beta-L-arabino-hexul-4-ose reductase